MRSTPRTPTTPRWMRLVDVKVYPEMQEVRRGHDVVIQCRDEGRLREAVVWDRVGGGGMTVRARQNHGRLEISGVRMEDEGVYICKAVGHEKEPGGSKTSGRLHTEQMQAYVSAFKG